MSALRKDIGNGRGGGQYVSAIRGMCHLRTGEDGVGITSEIMFHGMRMHSENGRYEEDWRIHPHPLEHIVAEVHLMRVHL